MLARAGDRGLSREKITALLWPDADDEAARRGLTQALYALRGGLDAPELCEGVQQLRLNPAVVWCDVLAVEQALREGDLERAAGLYTGPFLDGFRLAGATDFERWVEEERAALTHRFDEMLEKLAQRATERGDPVQAAKWWRRRAGTDPHNARVAVALMRALAASGDAAGALAHARIYESLLRQELGAEPDASVTALVAELRSAPATTPAPAAVVSIAAPPPVVPVTAPVVEPAAPTTSTATASASVGSAATPAAESSPTLTPSRPPSRPPSRWRFVGPVLVGVLVTVAALWWRREPSPTRLSPLDTPLRVTSEEGLELDAALSPDAKQVAYAAEQDSHTRIMVRQRNGSRAIAVAPGLDADQRRPRWSPDGTQLLFEARRGIWLVPALGGTPRLVVKAPADTAYVARGVTWSPDGESIAWAEQDSVFIRRLAGGAVRPAARIPEVSALSWSPNGRWIAAVSGNVLFQYGNASNTTLRRTGIGNLSPSVIVLLASDCAGSCTHRELTTKTELNTSPEWLSSRELLFVSNRGGARDLFVQRLRGNGEVDGAPQRLTSGIDVASVSIAADGATLAYSVFRQSSNIWSLPLDSVSAQAGPTQVTRGTLTIEGVDASPDGQWLAYDANTLGQQDIFVMRVRDGRAVGDEIERVVDAPVDDFHPAWSPDGQWLAYYTFVEGVRRAMVIPAHGGDARLVHPNGPNREEHSPNWTGDGRTLLYFRDLGTSHQIYASTRRADGGWDPERRITTRSGLGAMAALNGVTVYFERFGVLRTLPPSLDESASRVVYRSPLLPSQGVVASSARILPNGGRIVIKGFDAAGSGVWTLPISGGTPRLVARLDDLDRPSIRPEFGTDGRYIYYTRVEQSADIWSMQLKR